MPERRGREAPAWPAGFGADPGATVVCCDFDGTLAPIVGEPEAAVPLPGTREILSSLLARSYRFAVVSGRPAAFLLDRLGGIPGLTLVGLYGMERVSAAGKTIRNRSALAWEPTLRAVALAARPGEREGVLVEPKGLAVTLHWRTAPEPTRARRWAEELAGEQARRLGLQVHLGRMSLELRPPVPTDKGAVVAEICRGAASAAFLGDDAGDLPAFDALDQLDRSGTAAVRVAVRSPEAPADLVARADLVVDGPEGALALLASLP
ncbi:MAG: trehalose-phosphatase [Acidimicrobiales bacterium]